MAKRQPTFRHHTKLPFTLDWDEACALWVLVLPPEMEELDILGRIGGTFSDGREERYFGHEALKHNVEVLQAALEASVRAQDFEVAGITSFTFSRPDDRHVVIAGPDLGEVARLMRLEASPENGKLVLRKRIDLERLDEICDFIRAMEPHLASQVAPHGEIAGLRGETWATVRKWQTCFRGPMVRALEQSTGSVKHIYHIFHMPERLTVANWQLPELEAAVIAHCQARAKIVAELRKRVAATDEITRIADVVRFEVTDFAVSVQVARSALNSYLSSHLGKFGFGHDHLPALPLDKLAYIRLIREGESAAHVLSDILGIARYLGRKRKSAA